MADTKKAEAIKELAIRELERRHKDKQDDLIKFIKFFFEQEKNQEFQHNWHHDVIAKKLDEVLTGETTRLIINIPPGHMKTELVTKCFPVWAMGKDPTREIIATGYSTSLTQTYSSQARDYYKSETFKQVFPRRPDLRSDQDTKEWWANEQGGGYFATGASGSITGRRFHCVAAGTKIKTDNGVINIESLAQSWYGVKVLSYNHETNKSEYREIKAFKETKKQKVWELITSGGARVEATRDHRLYTLEQGYVPMDKVKVGDTVLINGYEDGVCSMQCRDCEESLRNKKGIKERAKEFFLWVKLFFKARKRKKENTVSSLRGRTRVFYKKVLQALQGKTERGKGSSKRKAVRRMCEDVLSLLNKKCILLKELCKHGSFKKNDGEKQFSPQRRNECHQDSFRNKAVYLSKRLGCLCGLWSEKQSCDSSYRRKPKEKCSRKLDSSLCELPLHSPQVKEDTVSMVRPVRNKSVSVYDIQVEETNNFFANEILVHNCFIIDDPLRPDDGESTVKRESVNNWYDNTVLSRLYNPLTDAVVIIMQRIHDADLCGYLIDKMKKQTGEDFEVLSLPAIATEKDGYRDIGEALHVDRYPVEALQKIKKSYGPTNFSCQYQQDPVSEEIREFKSGWIKRYDSHPTRLRIRIIVDLASSENPRSDENAIIVMGQAADQRRYVLASWGDWGNEGKRFNPDEMINKIYEYADQWGEVDRQLKIYVESVSYQRTMVYGLKEHARRRRHQGKKIYQIEELKTPTTRSKSDKIRALIPYMSNDMIFFPHGGSAILEQQLLRFPKGAKVDRIDVLAMDLDLDRKPAPHKPSRQKPQQYDQRTGRLLKH